MPNSSTKSLPLSSLYSFEAVVRGFLDEDDLEDVVRFHVITFVTFCEGSTQTWKPKLCKAKASNVAVNQPMTKVVLR